MLILDRYRARQRRRCVSRLRDHLAFFGHDVSNLTDDEIEQGIVRASRLWAQAGFSVEVATEAMRQLGAAVNEHGSPVWPPPMVATDHIAWQGER